MANGTVPCHSPEEPSSLQWKARTALTSLGRMPIDGSSASKASTTSSQTDPHPQPHVPDPGQAILETMRGTQMTSPHEAQSTSLASRLCYACLTAFSNGTAGLKPLTSAANQDGTSGLQVELPYWVLERTRVGKRATAMGMTEMREAIEDCLLDDD